MQGEEGYHPAGCTMLRGGEGDQQRGWSAIQGPEALQCGIKARDSGGEWMEKSHSGKCLLRLLTQIYLNASRPFSCMPAFKNKTKQTQTTTNLILKPLVSNVDFAKDFRGDGLCLMLQSKLFFFF